MAVELKMLQMDQTMTKGKIGKWLVKEGDTVTEGQPLLEIETDKVVHEQESPTEGVIAQILAEEGTNVPVNALLAVIGAPGEEVPRVEADTAVAQQEPEQEEQVQPTQPKATPSPTPVALKASPAARQLAEKLAIDLVEVTASGPGGRILEGDVQRYIDLRGPLPTEAARLKASPLARRLAKEHGVNLSSIAGSGPDGRIVRDDVLQAASTAPEIPTVETPALQQGTEVIAMDGIRGIIAERMTLSLQTNASVTLHTEVDATAFVELRGMLNDKLQAREVNITYTDLLVKVVANALREHPRLNATLTDEGIHLLREINIGVAVALEDGLVVPVVRDADKERLSEISTQVKDFAERARGNQLTPGELQGGTFTITNLGNFGIDAFTPIINPPESAILGVGRILKKPVVHEDEIVVRSMLTLSLTFDHRVVDGAPAAQFLQTVSGYIQDPYLLLV
ncbi:2-oxo acid dehydrogenase subunit E2 [Candidatus Poribacteria bacterium]|nr:2-oxo acid dehydrogenase subunit E2 [Candidatus Poribacteria bacterium]MYH81649.1 2-oxo acid dehydrogenase subunit E2 [Candidatus Poribacteria bacterium]MYK96210.1 2-oxo acid dehydrogenase subunit E2 [Candidatus Poribacteria bacterium]